MGQAVAVAPVVPKFSFSKSHPPRGISDTEQSRLPVNLKNQVDVGTRLSGSEQGQAVAEYAMLLGILLGFLAILTAIGFNANRVFNWVNSALN